MSALRKYAPARLLVGAPNDGCGCDCPQCGVRKRVSGWVGIAEFDDRPVFGRCFPKSRSSVVSFYETASGRPAPEARLVGVHQQWARVVLSAMRSVDRTPGCCGCVVGRVVEVEFIGVRGRTRGPVLDFRPAGGVIVVARAGTSTYVTPSWQVARRRVVSPRGFMGVR